MTAAAKSTRELSAEVSVLKENLGKTLSQQKILKDFQEVRSQIEAAAAEVDKAQKDLLNLQKTAAQNKVGIDKGALAKKQAAENEAMTSIS